MAGSTSRCCQVPSATRRPDACSSSRSTGRSRCPDGRGRKLQSGGQLMRAIRRTAPWVTLFGVIAGAVTVAQSARSWTGITAERLLKPEAGDWISYRRTDDVTAFSPLRQIDRTTVRAAAPGVVLFDAGQPALAGDAHRRQRPDVRARRQRPRDRLRRRVRRRRLDPRATVPRRHRDFGRLRAHARSLDLSRHAVLGHRRFLSGRAGRTHAASCAGK